MGIARSREQGPKRMVATMKSKVDHDPVHVDVMHAYASDDAERLKECVSAELNCIELWTNELSPVMGYATGTGTLAVAF